MIFKKLSEKHKRFLLISQGLFALVTNFAINAVISWYTMKKYADLTIWGEAGVGVDILATGFLLPFLSCLIISPILRNRIKRGQLQPLKAEQVGGNMHNRSILVRGVILGLIGLLLASVPLILVFKYFWTLPIPLWSFIWIKGSWAGVLGGIVAPFIAYWVLADTSEKENSNRKITI